MSEAWDNQLLKTDQQLIASLCYRFQSELAVRLPVCGTFDVRQLSLLGVNAFKVIFSLSATLHYIDVFTKERWYRQFTCKKIIK